MTCKSKIAKEIFAFPQEVELLFYCVAVAKHDMGEYDLTQ